MTEFTPYPAAIGGIIIGIAAIALLLSIGKIAGISGIFAQTALQKPRAISWQMTFIIGLILAPLIAQPLGYGLPTTIDLSWPQIVIGGLLVGFGSRYGSGCTSGHGICGIGRFSKRSIVATITFMATAVITVFITRHVLGV